MSRATIVGAAIYLLVGGACATGGMNTGDDKIDASTSGHHDASSVVQPDAPKQHLDAGVVHMDAPQVSQTPDASTSGGVFCTGNSQCTNAGECCVTLGGPQGFCGPGTVVLGTCVPQ